MKILTWIQPSWALHIWNYFWAVKQMIDIQDSKNVEDDVFMFVADLHALTSLHDSLLLKNNVNDIILDYIACWIDPEKTILYVQSDIPEVLELMWYLMTITPMWQLEQAHSYKDKVSKWVSSNAWLFTYPVLMAADILIVNSDVIPVWKDQIQHVEIARDLAKKFNNEYWEVFNIPEVKIIKNTEVVPWIDWQKMSKSYKNTIPLFWSESEVKKAVMSIVTDSLWINDKKDPDKCNIFAIYKLFSDKNELDLMREKYLNWWYWYWEAKKELFEKIKEYFTPMWDIRNKLKSNKWLIEDIRKSWAEKMRKHVIPILNKCRYKVWVL